VIQSWCEYVSFLVKITGDCLSRVKDTDNLKEIILTQKEQLMEMCCLAGESNQLVVRSQGQYLFRCLLSNVFSLEIDMREEVEVMYTKVVLKPLELINMKIMHAEETKKQEGSDSDEDITKAPQLQEVVGAGELTGSPMGQAESKMFVDMHTNFAFETLMSFTPGQLAQFFLVYDCQ